MYITYMSYSFVAYIVKFLIPNSHILLDFLKIFSVFSNGTDIDAWKEHAARVLEMDPVRC